MRVLFIANYPALSKLTQGITGPGLIVVAITRDTLQIESTVSISGYREQTNSAVLGRHDATDLFLCDNALSLRHLAFVVEPVGADPTIRYRCIDLGTRTGFADEYGRRLKSIFCDGPLFISCGKYVLFILPTPSQLSLKASPEAAWSLVPPRIYQEESVYRGAETLYGSVESGANNRVAGTAGMVGEIDTANSTLVLVDGPPLRDTFEWYQEGDRLLGILAIRSESSEFRFPVGARALQRGIIVGRSEESDPDGARVLSDESISRVHVIILSIDGKVIAIDASSSNGTFTNNVAPSRRVRRESTAELPPASKGQSWNEVRTVLLSREGEVCIGDGDTTFRWEPAT